MEKLLVNSLPKSGTNLLQRVVEIIGYKYSKKSISSANILSDFYFFRSLFRGSLFDKRQVIVGLDVKVSISQRWIEKRLRSIKKGEYISGHLNFSEYIFYLLYKHNFKIIHIIRDPRDVLLSHIFYAKKEKKHLFHNIYKSLSIDEAINITLQGGFYNGLYMNSFKKILEDTYGWIRESQKKSNILIVKFEDLVGEKGGGSKMKQLNTINDISKFLKINCDINVDKLSNNLYGRSHTFRSGKVSSWKKELNKEQVKKIEKEVGNYIELFGYELYA
jgi:hypothetical protein